METSKDLPKFAVLQLSGCSGCEVSLLNSEEWISNFKLVYMPLVVTSNKIPDDVEVLLVTGGVRTDEDIHNLRKGRSRTKKLIAVGTCALSGGVAQFKGNHIARESFLKAERQASLFRFKRHYIRQLLIRHHNFYNSLAIGSDFIWLEK